MRDSAEQSPGESSLPLYQVVVRALQSEIVRGIYPVGTQLPSEAALSARFGVSRQTVRQALRVLRESGLVKSRQGLGTIVQRPGSSEGYVHHVDTISDLFPVDVDTRYELPDGKFVALPDWAQVFDEVRPAQDWLYLRGGRFETGAIEPFNEVDIFVAARFAGVGRLIGSHSGAVYTGIEMIYGETVREVQQVIGTFTCDGDRGARIALKEGDSGIEIRRLYKVASEDVALISFNRYHLQGFTFSMAFRRV
jgi:DNA-binding GntR family transcriptional regulator